MADSTCKVVFCADEKTARPLKISWDYEMECYHVDTIQIGDDPIPCGGSSEDPFPATPRVDGEPISFDSDTIEDLKKDLLDEGFHAQYVEEVLSNIQENMK